ncbi:2-hydroxychromene-2-carboxylate isomerase [Aestuariivita sp.]|jgi:2-hydroxychromene-2-carboxylate isomerase|uniref:2-hydroxychromene-2-carboxylate isomerase n=1 Tax=Aestuariivita sp. TaxID=1872407 RepID=UPI00216CFC79|nr:2-hydroxychromene-2-carboxylate isomerase [Aestuariivita sp.]MCE8006675.1 2-hydroxychromene-2-carboxylate isomerase [Aestuariivita sp.]
MARIDYFYSAHSAFAYLGARRLYEICAAQGAELVHRPMLLSPVMEAAGGLPFAGRSQAHVDYFFGREIERWAEWRDVPIIRFRPTYHDAPYDLANRVIMAAGPTADALSLSILRAHWRDDADLSDQATLRSLIVEAGLDPEILVAIAEAPETQEAHRANTEEAIRSGLFGSPSYVVDGDVFYGQDRLEMVERALAQPFGPTRWANPTVAPEAG